MSTRYSSSVIATITVVVVFPLVSGPAAGQPPLPTPPEAHTWEPPRTPDGQPDIRGHWSQSNRITTYSIQEGSADRAVHIRITGQEEAVGRPIIDPPDGKIPYQPWAAEQKQRNYENRLTADPESRCTMPGVPRVTYMPYPFQILQFSDRVLFLYEYVHTTRTVYMNGSDHLEGQIGFWMGDSRGHWEGDTLVIDVIHFNDETWFDRAGNFHSEALHVVERYTPTGPAHLTYEVTIEDPNVFTDSWKMEMPLYRRQEADIEVLEYECFAYIEQELEDPQPER